MQQGAIVFRWGSSVRGREQKALAVFAESAAYWDDLVKNGRAAGHYPYFSTNRDGGMWILRGDVAELRALQDEEDYQRLIVKVQHVVEDFSAEVCIGGSVEDLSGPLGIYSEVIQDLS